MPDEANILPSLVDRLLDNEPDEREARAEPSHKRFQTMRQYRQSIKRDLEALLNSKRWGWDDLPSGVEEVSRSLITYGLPDRSSLYESDAERIRRAIERAIIDFEPRLTQVHVAIPESQPVHPSAGGLYFHVEAILHVELAPEQITFDAVFESTTHQYQVWGLD